MICIYANLSFSSTLCFTKKVFTYFYSYLCCFSASAKEPVAIIFDISLSLSSKSFISCIIIVFIYVQQRKIQPKLINQAEQESPKSCQTGGKNQARNIETREERIHWTSWHLDSKKRWILNWEFYHNQKQKGRGVCLRNTFPLAKGESENSRFWQTNSKNNILRRSVQKKSWGIRLKKC